jgi:L-amino acid N-acyltransferase YncA
MAVVLVVNRYRPHDAEKEKTVTIRPMTASDRAEARSVARRCFGYVAMIFFDFGKQTFVCEQEGKIIGGVSLGLFVAGTRSYGVVKWIFTLPESRGQGAANRLVQTALSWFDGQGCDDVLACVEGHNTASSNRFFDAGFRLLGFRDQLERFGSTLPRVWAGVFHLFDIGHFVWVRCGDGDPPVPRHTRAGQTGAWVATLLANTAILTLMTIRTSGPASLSAGRIGALLFAVALLLSVRTAAMLLTARAVGLVMVYRPWETGVMLSAIVSGIFGGIVPAWGSVYPVEPRWRYRDQLPRLGPIAAVGAGELISLAWILWALVLWLEPGTPLHFVLATAAMLARVSLVFEVVIPVFPLACYNGRRILDWKPPVWFLLTAVSVALLVTNALMGV